ncbi:MAG: AMP-binding protein [bacterium]|nr:AMP-binding protein [bacterium]
MQIGPNTSTLIDGWLEAGRGSETALITADDQPWTAAELYRAMCNVAARLAEAGIGQGDRLLLVLDDTPAFPAVFLGAMRIGATPIPVNFLCRPDDFGHFLDDSQARTAAVDHAFLEIVGPQVAARPHVKLVVANGAPPDGAASLDHWMRPVRPRSRLSPLNLKTWLSGCTRLDPQDYRRESFIATATSLRPVRATRCLLPESAGGTLSSPVQRCSTPTDSGTI